MRRIGIFALGIGLPLLLLAGLIGGRLAVPAAQGRKLEAEPIGKAAGTRATVSPDGVVRIGWARTDVAVTVDGMALKPFAGLGSWAAFTPTAHGAMVMGDTVVFQDEVTPAMDAAFAAGLEVTALHNHMVGEQPAFYFTHFWGKGSTVELTQGLKSALDAQTRAGKKGH